MPFSRAFKARLVAMVLIILTGLDTLSAHSGSTPARTASDLSSHFSGVEILPDPGVRPGGFEEPAKDDRHYEGLRNYRGIEGYEDPYGRDPPPGIRRPGTVLHQGTLAELLQAKGEEELRVPRVQAQRQTEEPGFQAQLARQLRVLPAHVNLGEVLDRRLPASVETVARLLDEVAGRPEQEKLKIQQVVAAMPSYGLAERWLGSNAKGLSEITPFKVRLAAMRGRAARVLEQEETKRNLDKQLRYTIRAVVDFQRTVEHLDAVLGSEAFRGDEHRDGARFGQHPVATSRAFLRKAQDTLTSQVKRLQTVRAAIDRAAAKPKPQALHERLSLERLKAESRLVNLGRYSFDVESLSNKDVARLNRMLDDDEIRDLQQMLTAFGRLNRQAMRLIKANTPFPDLVMLEDALRLENLIDAYEKRGKPGVETFVARLDRWLTSEHTSWPGRQRFSGLD